MVRVDGNAGHRAQLHTLRLVKMTHTLGAALGVDLVNLLAQVNGLVGANRFTHITIDARLCDHQSHKTGLRFSLGVAGGVIMRLAGKAWVALIECKAYSA